MEKIRQNLKYIIILFIPIVIFGSALIIYFPGVITYDSFNQLNQVKSMQFNNMNPFFHTMIEMFLLKIWNNPAVIAIFQILVFSITWTIACLKTSNGKKSNYILQIILTLLLSILPLNFMTAITLWKDVLYSYSILLVTVLIYLWIEKKYEISLKMMLLLAVNIVLIMFFRHNGKLVGIAVAFVVTLITILKNKGNLKDKIIIKKIMMFPIMVIFIYIICKIPFYLFNVSNQSLTITPKLVQVIGAFSSSDAIDEEDRERLSEYLDLDRLNEVYNPYFVDVVREGIKDIPKANTKNVEMIGVIIKSSIKHLDIAFNYLFESTSIIWRFDKPRKADNVVYGTVICIDDYKDNEINYDKLSFVHEDTDIFKGLTSAIYYTTFNRPIRGLLYSHLVALIISIVGIIIVAKRNKRKAYYLVLLPNLLNVLSLVVSIPVQDTRYVYPTYIVEYFVLLLVIRELTENFDDFKAFFLRKARRTQDGIRYLKNRGVRSSIRNIGKKIKRAFTRKEGFDIYAEYIKNNEPDEKELEKQREYKSDLKISIIVPMYNTPEIFFKELVESVKNQTYSNWELCLADGSKEKANYIDDIISNDERIKYRLLDENLQIAGNTNEAIKMTKGDYVVLLDHDDTLTPFALYEVAKAVEKYKDLDFIYSDEHKIDINGRRYDPHFKPDFSPFLLRSYNYITHMAAIRKKIIDEIGGESDGYNGAQDYDLFFRITEKTEKIYHIPRVLYHWRVHEGSTAGSASAKTYAYESGKRAIEDHLKRLKIDGTVEHEQALGLYRVKYALNSRPKISIIIPNKDSKMDLKKCVDSILKKSTYDNYEIIIAENNSTKKDIFEYYNYLEREHDNIKVVYYKNNGFNFSKINNFAVKYAKGEYLLFLNNDIKAITPDFIEEMLGICMQNRVGIVGAKLIYPDHRIQHAGVVVGIGGIAGHINKLIDQNEVGYYARASVINNYSAVTAACMMVKKSLFEEVGCFTEDLAVAFNDIDFCLKVRELDLQIVYTPYAKLYHYESKSRGLEDTEEKIRRFEGEVKYFKERWKDILKNGDPYFNPNFRLDVPVYMVDSSKIDYEDRNLIK